ncbi:MAG: addiction module protein [Chthoniobacter sp.]
MLAIFNERLCAGGKRIELTGGTRYRLGMTVEQLTEEVLSWPSEARALLADRLVESLDPIEDDHIRQVWAVEARRRRDEVRSGRVRTVPGDEAMARVRASLAARRKA